MRRVSNIIMDVEGMLYLKFTTTYGMINHSINSQEIAMLFGLPLVILAHIRV